jgi:hypothetical protein
MPISKAGKKIKAKLKEQYGEKKGEGIFYAMENKGEIPGMNKMKGYAKGGDTKAKKKKEPVRTERTASGAQQMDRGMEAIERAREAIGDQFERLGGAKAFEEEYGRSYRSVLAELSAAEDANLANRLRREFGNSRENVFDRLERASAVRARQYNKGGMVKSTGKMNTGIRKCGE